MLSSTIDTDYTPKSLPKGTEMTYNIYDEIFPHISTMLEQLQKLGFNPKEASVYLAMMELGVISAVSVIAKKAGINRTTTYDILHQLEEKGVVISQIRKSSRYYEALPPEKIINYLNRQQDKYAKLSAEAKNLLPELQSHYRVAGRPRVYFYEGDEGLMQVYEETLTSKGEILGYASEQEGIGWYLDSYLKRRIEKKIPERAISPDTAQDRMRFSLDEKEFRQTHLVPKEKLDITPDINIFDNKIMIANWKEKLGIIIESEEIANALRYSYELAWEASAKYHEEIVKDIKNTTKNKKKN